MHGRAVVIMPNLFIIVGTFNHNRILKGCHYMLKNNPMGTNFEQTLPHNFPLLVQNSGAINGYLIDNKSLINAALAHSY
jgi:hypothetical protein